MAVPEYERFPRSPGERTAQQTVAVERRLRKLERNPKLWSLVQQVYALGTRGQGARTIADRGGLMLGGTGSAAYLLLGTANAANGSMLANGASVTQTTGPQNPTFYFDPADYDDVGLDTYFQLRCSVYSNATVGPARTFDVVLMSVAAAGTGPALTLVGSGATGVTLGNPGTSGEVTAKVTYALGALAAGHYMMGAVPIGGATAANSTVLFNARLEYFYLPTP